MQSTVSILDSQLFLRPQFVFHREHCLVYKEHLWPQIVNVRLSSYEESLLCTI
jgi:hypothetical protein